MLCKDYVMMLPHNRLLNNFNIKTMPEQYTDDVTMYARSPRVFDGSTDEHGMVSLVTSALMMRLGITVSRSTA